VNEPKRQILVAALKVFDLALIGVSFGLATLFVVYTNQPLSLAEFLSVRVTVSHCIISLILVAVWHALFSFCGFYRPTRHWSKHVDVVEIAMVAILATAILWIAALIFPIRMVTGLFLLAFAAFTTFLLLASRLFIKRVVNGIRGRERNLRCVLVLGTNSRAVDFARRIANPENGYQLVGFVDEEWAGFCRFRETGLPHVCDFGGLPEFLRRNVVDEVLLYLPLRSYSQRAFEVASLCEQHGIVMRFDVDIFGLRSASQRGDAAEPDLVATYDDVRNWGALMIKRALDIVISATALVLLAPLFAVVAILIKRSSPGPVFFLQARVGLNKRRFLIYKFRTMVPDAEKLQEKLESRNEVSGPVFKITNDPRITLIGKALRRTSIDELPQLINVLKGDMSLVGPRPLPWRDYEGFNEDWQRRRFSVKPGMTCLWQVNGRSSIPFEEWMKLDLEYMDQWSLALDLKILVRTIPAVLKGSGAA
jgi:exopolysaccharide biosynthesis polyprenyl glycosylphosphotransferase